MSAMNDMQPHFDKYQGEIRKAKNASGYTLPELSKLSGVPYSNVCDINAGRVKTPSLFYGAALCKVLGISLDRLMGLEPTDGHKEEKIHALELENVRLTGENKRLEDLNAVLSAQLSDHKPVIFSLIAVCAILVVAVIGYMIFDVRITYAGLFQSKGTSVLAVLLGFVLVFAVGAIVYAARIAHKCAK